MRIKHAIVSVWIVATCLAADSKPPVVNWSARDVSGVEVKVPATDRASVLAFVRVDQEQSRQALKQIQTTVSDAKQAQVIVVLSGPLAAERAKEIADSVPKEWSIVADIDFAASGRMNIHVWPTTLVIKTDGTQLAHLAGMAKSFATDLQAYLENAAGKLDDSALQQRLTTREVITDSPEQAAARHLEVALRLLEQGNVDQARTELSEGLKRDPQNPRLQLTLARVRVLLNEPKAAIEILDKLPPDSAPPWQVNLLRGRALIALEKWPDAKAVLPDALKLNPDPAEAHYLLGLCYQHDLDWPHAAEQFRLAFEKTANGHRAAK